MKDQFIQVICSIICSALLAVSVAAQYDARNIPHYLKSENSSELPPLRMPSMWMKAPFYPPGTDKHVSRYQSGLTSPDGFPIANACNGAPYDQTETWISVNPRNPLNIVANSNDIEYNGVRGYRMTAFVTTDGGRTWTRTLLPSNANLGTSLGGGQTNFDPALAFDADGNCYYGYGWARLGSDDRNGDNYVIVSKSTDGGMTWTNTPFVWFYEGLQNPPFNDKWLIAADNDPTSPHKNNVYVAWTHFSRNEQNYIAFSRSIDGGQSWEQPPLPLAYGSIQSPMPCVGPNGIVYIAYRSQSSGRVDANVRVSTDGGRTFQVVRTAQSVISLGTYNSSNGRYELTQKQNMRVSSYPAIAVDRSNGPRRGWVYVVQAGRHIQTQQIGIYLTRSTDRGQTWSSSIRVDDNNRGNDVFMPSIAVDPLTGVLGVLYYSSQNSQDNTGADAYLAISRDGGSTWRRFRLTPQTWYFRSPSTVSPQGSTGGNYWGDYTSIAAWGGKFYPCFWMPDSPTGTMSTNDTYVAIVTMGPQPVTDLVAMNSYQNPTQVRLSWKNPSATMLGEQLTDYTIIIYRNGTQIVQLPHGTSNYTDQGLIDGELYKYDVIVRTPDGLESTPASASVFTGGALEPLPPTNVIAIPDIEGIRLRWLNPGYHVDSTYFHDFNRIVFYVNNQPIDSVMVPQVQAGTSSSHLLRVPVKEFYWITLRAVGMRGSRITYSQASTQVLGYSGAPLRDLSVTFDPGTGDTVKVLGYMVRANDGTMSTAWGRTSVRSVSPPNCITDSPTGNYTVGTTSFLVLPPFVVPAGKTTFSLAHIALIRNSTSHFGAIQYSTDFGQTWQWWGSFNRGSAAQEWGSATIQTAPWLWIHRSLAQHVGDTVSLRFFLQAGGLGVDDGWYIDNIMLTDSVASVNYDPSLLQTISLEINPNPAQGHASISISVLRPSNVSIEILDMMGRNTIAQRSTLQVETRIDLTIDISHLPSGIYIVRCFSKEGSAATKLSVVR